MGYTESAERLAAIGQEFHRRGWVPGTSGNFSAALQHDPLRVAITESSADKGRLVPEQILEIDAAGTVLGPDRPRGRGRPSAETLLHLAVYRGRPAGAVLHTHSVYGTLLSEAAAADGGLRIEGFEMLKGLADVATHEHREWIPVVENSQDMRELSTEVTELLAERLAMHAFLIRRHGLYTWGRDLNEAARHVEILEFLMEVFWRSSESRSNNAPSVASNR
jgi:methylthioribulose-1-phosphate dehydratase